MNATSAFSLTRLLVVSGVVLAACGGQATTAPTAIAPAADVTAAPTRALQSTLPVDRMDATAAPAPALDATPDTRTVSGVGADLSGLNSFQMRMQWSFVGKDDAGVEKRGSFELMQETIRDKSTHMRMSASGDANAGSDGFETYQDGDAVYMITQKEGKTACVFMSSDDQKLDQADAYQPASVFGELRDARLVARGERINGTLTDHYRIAAGAAATVFGSLTVKSADVWIAQDKGYVVRYIGESTGTGVLMASGVKDAAYRWEYDILDADAVQPFVLPPECIAARPAGDIPIPEDAQEKMQLGEMQSFKVKRSMADLADWMRQTLLEKGWAAGDAGMTTDEMTQLTFRKDGRELSVMIVKDGELTNCIITETKAR